MHAEVGMGIVIRTHRLQLSLCLGAEHRAVRRLHHEALVHRLERLWLQYRKHTQMISHTLCCSGCNLGQAAYTRVPAAY